jgi:proteasome lid subunit RPN8/RPN11
MRVIIPREIHDEIMYYVDKSPIEISGLGRVKKHDNGDMEVVKVYLLEQENTGASTDIDAEAVAKLMFETRKDQGDLNFWWHSHVDMGVFWSGTDMATIQEFGKNGYLLSTVFNKKRQMRSSYFQGGTDFLPQLFMDELETVISNSLPKKLTNKWDKEYKSKAKQKTIRTFPSKGGYYKGYGYGGYTSPFWDEEPAPRKYIRKPKKAKTYLTDDTADIYANSLDMVLSPPEQDDWAILLAALRGEDFVNVKDEDVWKFYELWDGDYNQAQLHVITQQAMNEMENDEDFIDTELTNKRAK